MSVDLTRISDFLNRLLALDSIPDAPGALNGLQVENSGSVSKVAVAVDACQETIHLAAAEKADLLIVHHGLFWGPTQPLVDRFARRIRALFENDIAVYSAHLPLDCHPEVGNNAILADRLNLSDLGPFGDFSGIPIGFSGLIDLDRTAFLNNLTSILGSPPHLIPGGPTTIKKVAVVTGSAGSMIDQVKDAGLDTLVTGEGNHHSHFDAMEWGINVFYGGHYATETFGVKALGEKLEAEFGLPWTFLDNPTGL
ncbi:MAG: Nif3-like dinuclear metal center hexameric protein [Gemmatimonadota bacterium]|nr:Nif3-like dinuclear metal center hexameric protein [Gemmatimonadota bacterium]